MSAPERQLTDQDVPYWAGNGAPGETLADFRLTVTTARELCDEPDALGSGQLLGPLILEGARTIIVGDTGQGKTSLAFQLIRCTLDNQPFLDWEGTGEGGRALVVDLEQGRRSVKRGLRDAQLQERDDIDLVLVPDGLSLDRNQSEVDELDRVISIGGYTIVNLDPYYKAHRADEPNAERPIVDLMRTLDRLRARHGFALILPAHPRKDTVGAPTVRKLTIHDIAGSGAVTRGAEIVLAIERVAYGLARLRFLKDREGDLPIGEAWNLHYTRDQGFTRDPKDDATPRDYRTELLNASTDGEWRTAREYMDATEAGDKAVKNELRTLTDEGLLEHQQGPPGRAKNAKCWRLTTASGGQMQTNDQHDPQTNENTSPHADSAPPNAADAAMQHKGALAPRMQPNAAKTPPQTTQEDRPAASGVSPVRGEHPSAEGGTSPQSLHLDPDAAWLDQITPDPDELALPAGELDDQPK